MKTPRRIASLGLLLAFAVNAANARVAESFDANWHFLKGGLPGAEHPQFNDRAWRELNVPNDWSIAGSFCETNPAGGEGAFLPCSFWLADAYVLTGRRAQGEALFERLLALANDVGLLAEEYDPRERRMLGNFPQALTHMALVNSARLLSMPEHETRGASAQGERPAAAALSS